MTEDGEALRRRLYRPGAEETDVAAYLAAAEPEPEAEARVPESPRRRPRWAVPAAAALVAVGLVLAHVTAGAAPVPPALPARDVPATTSAAFVEALEAGRDAGLGPWWEPGAPYLESHGTGDGTVELPVSASARGGRLTVLLVVGRDGTAGWSAARLVIHDDRTIHLRQQAAATGAVRAGVPAIGRVVYSAQHQPMRLFVQVPDGTRWGVAAVFDA